MEIIAKIKWVGQMETYSDSKGGEAYALEVLLSVPRMYATEEEGLRVEGDLLAVRVYGDRARRFGLLPGTVITASLRCSTQLRKDREGYFQTVSMLRCAAVDWDLL